MADRINLAALRDRALEHGPEGVRIFVDCLEVLALVDAVRALDEVVCPWDGWNFPDHSPVGRARAALAAFDLAPVPSRG